MPLGIVEEIRLGNYIQAQNKMIEESFLSVDISSPINAALMWCIFNDEGNLAEELIRKGANIQEAFNILLFSFNKRVGWNLLELSGMSFFAGKRLLHFTTLALKLYQTGKVDVNALIEEAGIKRPLLYALARKNRAYAVCFLKKLGADVQSSFNMAYERDNFKAAKVIFQARTFNRDSDNIKDKIGRNIPDISKYLNSALKEGDFDKIEFLAHLLFYDRHFVKNFDLEMDHYEDYLFDLLIQAIDKNLVCTVKFILMKGIDPNQRITKLNSSDPALIGLTPLHWAFKRPKPIFEVIEILLEAGADPTLKSEAIDSGGMSVFDFARPIYGDKFLNLLSTKTKDEIFWNEDLLPSPPSSRSDEEFYILNPHSLKK